MPEKREHNNCKAKFFGNEPKVAVSRTCAKLKLCCGLNTVHQQSSLGAVLNEAKKVGVSAHNLGTLVGVTTHTNTKTGACSEQQNSNQARETRGDHIALANF